MAPRIVHCSVAVPGYTVPTSGVLRGIEALYGEGGKEDVSRLVLPNGVEQRHVAYPVRELVQARSLDEKSGQYLEVARKLGGEALRRSLSQGGLAPKDVDLLVTTSCTGFGLPSLDAYLANEFGMRDDLRRLPITELGCGAGAAGIGFAADYVRAHPGSVAVVVAVEVPSLCLQIGDSRRENIIATALFGDGAGACVVTDGSGAGLEILDARSHFIESTLDLLGFKLGGNGFSIVLSRELPVVVKRCLGHAVHRLLEGNGVAAAQLGFYVIHPGGRNVLEAAEKALGLAQGELWASRNALEQFGNTSSASIFFVLEELLSKRPPNEGELGLVAAMSPGFSLELLLCRWRESDGRVN